MDEKASVNIRPADNGGFIVSRSWQEGDGDKTKYKDQTLIYIEAPTTQELKAMFEPGEYKKGEDRVKKIAEDLEEKPEKKPKWVDDGKDYDEEPKKGMFGRAGK